MNNVERLIITTPSERQIVMTRAFAAPQAVVFECWTRPEYVRRWMLGPDGWTMPVCEIDLRVGGGYRFVWRGPDGSEMGMGGVYREIVPPERLVSSELFDDDWTSGEALTTVVFSEHAGTTTVTNTVVYSSREARDAALRSGMTDGVSAGYDRLDDVLALLIW